jgi:histidinol-phosphate/aromatic aminotransferase/cobyric acid decarboxylase-like protein
MDFFADKSISTLLLVNPDNPSGNFIPFNDVLLLADWCKERGTRLVLDESFVDFSDDFEVNSALHDTILTAHKNLVVMKSISKSYGVPGVRLGIMASADIELINRMRKDVAIWNINSFAEYYLQIYGKYTNSYTKACQLFIAERKRFLTLLQQVEFLHVLPSQANFVLCKVTSKYSSTELTQLLLSRYNILVKDCNTKNGLEGRNLIRIAIRNSEDNDALVRALREL